MPHRFVTTAFIGFFATLFQAVALVPTGLFIFAMATTTLFHNEGGVGLEDAAQESVQAPADQVGGFDGEFITVTAPIQASSDVGDPVFFEATGTVQVSRDVQVWAWQEHVSTETNREWGGGRTITTVVEYTQGWTSNPQPPEAFQHPEGHENPQAPYSTITFVPPHFTLGQWTLDPMWAQILGGVAVAPTDVQWTETGKRLTYDEESSWYYLDRANAEAPPALGDTRVRFVRVPSNSVFTAFAIGEEGELAPVDWAEAVSAVVLLPGTRTDAMNTLRGFDSLLQWLIRLAGAIGILVGLVFITGPLFAVFDIVPPVGFVARIVGAVVLIPVAIGWAVTVCCFSQLVRSPVVLIILGLLLFGVGRAWWAGREARRKQSAMQPTQASPA